MKLEYDLEKSFDNEEAEKWLSLSVDKIVKPVDIVRKSMYDFDLETPEGIEKLMALLPIMDPDILKDIMTEIWPGYPTDVDARRHRLEIKGFLKDYLESYDDEVAIEQQQALNAGGEEGTGGGEEVSTPAEEANAGGEEGVEAGASAGAPPAEEADQDVGNTGAPKSGTTD